MSSPTRADERFGDRLASLVGDLAHHRDPSCEDDFSGRFVSRLDRKFLATQTRLVRRVFGLADLRADELHRLRHALELPDAFAVGPQTIGIAQLARPRETDLQYDPRVRHGLAFAVDHDATDRPGLLQLDRLRLVIVKVVSRGVEAVARLVNAEVERLQVRRLLDDDASLRVRLQVDSVARLIEQPPCAESNFFQRRLRRQIDLRPRNRLTFRPHDLQLEHGVR